MAEKFAGTALVTKSGETVDAAQALKGKIVALYFSAHWCPPCQAFTPLLKDFYEEVNSDERVFEVVFVSSDDSEEQMTDYFQKSHGDYLAIPYTSGAALRKELKVEYGYFGMRESEGLGNPARKNGIPTLAVIAPNGNVLTDSGVNDVETKGPTVIKAWGKL